MNVLFTTSLSFVAKNTYYIEMEKIKGTFCINTTAGEYIGWDTFGLQKRGPNKNVS